MIFTTKRAALASLREFDKATRTRHTVVRFWSTTENVYKYVRVFK